MKKLAHIFDPDDPSRTICFFLAGRPSGFSGLRIFTAPTDDDSELCPACNYAADRKLAPHATKHRPGAARPLRPPSRIT